MELNAEEFAELEAADVAAFDAYIENLTKDEPEEDYPNPTNFGPSPYYELELMSLHRLAFAVADNPFVKTDVTRFYPEIHIIGADGTVNASIGPKAKKCDKYATSVYTEGFRDERLKINDDRKVKLTLKEFIDAGASHENMMILLTVRMNPESKKEKSDYSQAWFRLQNEDTNQTIDYSYIEKIKKEAGIEDDAEEEAEAVEEEEEDGEAKLVKENIFLAGRIYREDTWTTVTKPAEDEGEEPVEEKKLTTKWIYERWNQVVTNEKFPDVAKTMGELMQKSS